MLTNHEIDTLNCCLPSDHILLALENSEHLGEVKITASKEIQWLTAFSVATGRDLQSIFESDEYIYYTLFIDRKYINHQLKELLDKYDLLDTFQTNPSANITLSFPVKRN